MQTNVVYICKIAMLELCCSHCPLSWQGRQRRENWALFLRRCSSCLPVSINCQNYTTDSRKR